ncbi:MAG: glycosyltransferase [Patescibacteria group bacterium]
MSDKIFVSVIIPTLARPKIVFNLVEDLRRQSYQNFEIIVVDQSREENKKLKDLTIGSHDRLKYFKLEKEGTCPAKNFGLKKAAGQIIIFLDDDTEVKNPDFITYHVVNYLDVKTGGVGGKVVDKNLKLNKGQKGPILRVSKTGRVFPNSQSEIKQEINAPRGGNVSYRKKVIDDIGGFDERFIGNAMREETDLSLRVFKAGYKIIFEPKAKLVHLGVGRGGSRQKNRLDWYFDFFHNETLFFLKHFPRKYFPLLVFRKIRPIIACMFWYGWFRPKSLATPIKGFMAGYRSYKFENPKSKAQSTK